MVRRLHRNPSTGKLARNPITGKLQVIGFPRCTNCGSEPVPLEIDITFSGVTINDGCGLTTIPSYTEYFDVPDINQRYFLAPTAIPCIWQHSEPVTASRELSLIEEGDCINPFRTDIYNELRITLNVGPSSIALVASLAGTTSVDIFRNFGYTADLGCVDKLDVPGLDGRLFTVAGNGGEAKVLGVL